MIKSEFVNNLEVKPFWNQNGTSKKKVKESHSKFTLEPYPNIICCARKKSGKTTVALNIIMLCMTTKTKLYIFSPDILQDTDNRKAIELLVKNFGADNITICKSFIDSDGNNMLLEAIDDASESFQHAKEDIKSKYTYPSTILYFDDLNEDDLKSKELGHFAQNNRHYGAMCIYSSQDWINFEPRIRKNCDILMLWASMPKDRLKDVYQTIQPGIKFEEFDKMYNFATSEPRSFLYVDVPNKIFRKNLNEELYIKRL